MKQVLKVLADKSEDRYIFITYKNNKIVGLNFHQGIGAIDYYFATIDEFLTKIFFKMFDGIEIESVTEDILHQGFTDAINSFLEMDRYSDELLAKYLTKILEGK